jgi:hypothetical protein
MRNSDGQIAIWRGEAGAEPAMTARENCRYFFPKIGLSVRLKILFIWIAAPAMNASSTKQHRKIRRSPDALEAIRRDAWNAVPRRPKCGRKGRPEVKNLDTIKGRLEAL